MVNLRRYVRAGVLQYDFFLTSMTKGNNCVGEKNPNSQKIFQDVFQKNSKCETFVF